LNFIAILDPAQKTFPLFKSTIRKITRLIFPDLLLGGEHVEKEFVDFIHGRVPVERMSGISISGDTGTSHRDS
jgi:hypothetical protein